MIVMTGTIEMLRAQTQRRIDMEMVGRQNILGDLSPEQAAESKVDYQDDAAWVNGEFIDLGEDELATEIRRLTQHRKDYQKQFRTLKIDRFDMGRPLYATQNLFRSAARVAIVKKNATVLRKLVTDIKANKNAFAEIPVLLIDDESDQASINTVDPEKVRAAKAEGKEIKKRRAINEQIAAMLELMPRAQYVGYTATPFANVFVDPSDEQGIFPKDFVIGLQRPPDYMGIDDFHDLDESPDGERTFANSNEKAFVRNLEAKDDEPDIQDEELAKAIDAFVLTGAVKLYREAVDPSLALTFRHHTMLVHDSVLTADHRDIADRVKALWKGADFVGPAGKARLKAFYEIDIRPVASGSYRGGHPSRPRFRRTGFLCSEGDRSDHRAQRQPGDRRQQRQGCSAATAGIGLRPPQHLAHPRRWRKAEPWVHRRGAHDHLLPTCHQHERLAHTDGPLVWFSTRLPRPRTAVYRTLCEVRHKDSRSV